MATQRTTGRWYLITLIVLVLLPVLASAQIPVILETAPSGSTNATSILLEATTDTPSICRYADSPLEFASMTNNLTGLSYHHEADLGALSEGAHTYYIHCSNDTNSTDDPAEVVFTVDRTPPVILTTSPTGTVNSKVVDLVITTSEAAACRWGEQNLSYDDLSNPFTTTGGTLHKITLTLDQRSYTIFTACRDPTGNTAPTATYGFTTNLPPSAQISGLSSSDPIKAGTYRITLVSSEPLIEAPILQYDFNDDATKKPVSMVGSGTEWKGYLLIGEDTPNKVGTFYFSGKDEQGMQGTEITDGKLFLVDTTKPPAPVDVAATEDAKRRIELDWYYDGEEADHFNIYRSTQQGTEYTDFLEDVDDDHYVDRHVDEFTTYYYRVAAVDKAGNEGPLSEEVEGYATDSEYEEPPAQERSLLTAAQRQRINQTIKVIQKDMLDVEQQVKELEQESDPDRVLVINELGLVKQAKNVQLNLENLVFELQGLDSDSMEDSDLDKTLEQFEQNALKYKTDVAFNIAIRGSSSYPDVVDPADMQTAIAEATLGLGLDQDQLSDYREACQELSDRISIETKAVSATISFLGTAADQDVLVITKTLTAASPVEDVAFVELIPKEVARRASDVVFAAEPEVLKQDPVVQWTYASFSTGTIQYRVNAAVDLATAKSLSTVPLVDPDAYFAPPPDESAITGNAPSETGHAWQLDYGNTLIVLAIFIVMGLLVYYFFFMKAEERFEQEQEGKEPTSLSRLRSAWGRVRSLVRPSPRIVPAHSASVVLPEEDAGHAFTQSIALAHLHANNLHYAPAYNHYVQALNLYHDLEQGAVQQDAALELNKVYTKLSLIQILQQGHDYVDKKNVIRLRQLLLESGQLLNHIPESLENTELGTTAKKAQAYFIQALAAFEQHLSFDTSWLDQLDF